MSDRVGWWDEDQGSRSGVQINIINGAVDSGRRPPKNSESSGLWWLVAAVAVVAGGLTINLARRTPATEGSQIATELTTPMGIGGASPDTESSTDTTSLECTSTGFSMGDYLLQRCILSTLRIEDGVLIAPLDLSPIDDSAPQTGLASTTSYAKAVLALADDEQVGITGCEEMLDRVTLDAESIYLEQGEPEEYEAVRLVSVDLPRSTAEVPVVCSQDT